jgi:DNA repair photolyase
VVQEDLLYADWESQHDEELPIPDIGVTIKRQIFGALSQDNNDPLSRVSIANSSFSLDPFKGCPGRCAYCTVAGAARDIDIFSTPHGVHTQIKLPARPEQLFTGQELAQVLMHHPAFIKDKSVVSIGTASTESFLPIVERETWGAMEAFLEAGYTNPFWIVTKFGIPDDISSLWYDRFCLLKSKGINVVISVTESGAPRWVEPYRGNRFRNMERIRQAGVRISLHLRPILARVNDSDKCIKRALDAAIGIVENICVGGLRKDLGVAIAWEHVYGLDPTLLPGNGNRRKDIPNDYIAKVRACVSVHGSEIPVFTRSSEAISHLLSIPEYNLYRYRPNDTVCFLSIPWHMQESIRVQHGMPLTQIIEANVTATVNGDAIVLNKVLSYRGHRSLIHALGHSGLLP